MAAPYMSETDFLSFIRTTKDSVLELAKNIPPFVGVIRIPAFLKNLPVLEIEKVHDLGYSWLSGARYGASSRLNHEMGAPFKDEADLRTRVITHFQQSRGMGRERRPPFVTTEDVFCRQATQNDVDALNANINTALKSLIGEIDAAALRQDFNGCVAFVRNKYQISTADDALGVLYSAGIPLFEARLNPNDRKLAALFFETVAGADNRKMFEHSLLGEAARAGFDFGNAASLLRHVRNIIPSGVYETENLALTARAKAASAGKIAPKPMRAGDVRVGNIGIGEVRQQDADRRGTSKPPRDHGPAPRWTPQKP